MKAVRAGKVDVVLCYNLDRLGRSLSQLVQLLGEFAAQKVALIVSGQVINTSSSNPASALLLNMLGRSRSSSTRLSSSASTLALPPQGREESNSGAGRRWAYTAVKLPDCGSLDIQAAPSRRTSGSQVRRSSNSLPDSKRDRSTICQRAGGANEDRFGTNLGPPDPPVFGVANDLKKVRFLARLQRNRSDTPWFPPAK